MNSHSFLCKIRKTLLNYAKFWAYEAYGSDSKDKSGKRQHFGCLSELALIPSEICSWVIFPRKKEKLMRNLVILILLEA